jgi:hypothetical protein
VLYFLLDVIWLFRGGMLKLEFFSGFISKFFCSLFCKSVGS